MPGFSQSRGFSRGGGGFISNQSPPYWGFPRASTVIAFDNSSTGGGATASSFTWQHTTAGTNRILFIGVFTVNPNAVLSVTYAGQAAILVPNGNCNFSAGQSVYLYQLINPTLGTNNVVVTLNASINAGAGAVSYNGVRQFNQPDNSAQFTNAASTSISGSVVTVANNCWGVGIARNNASNVTWAVGTMRLNETLGQGFSVGDVGPVAAGGTLTLTTASGSGNNGLIVTSVAP
jgi:hypothetical protein